MNVDVDQYEARLRPDGYTVIDDFLTASQLELARMVVQSHGTPGSDKIVCERP